MMQLISLFCLIPLSVSLPTKRLLQYSEIQTLGSYGQICIPPQSDFQCQFTGMALTDQFSGTVECGPDYGCCLCQSIVCGSHIKPCDSFKAGTEKSVFGVQDIRIYGEPDSSGAVLDCGAEFACADASFIGSWIDTIQCLGESSCNAASFDLVQSRGVVCGKQACVNGRFLLNSNIDGQIFCAAREACVGALIEINGIENVVCNGQSACQNAKITVTNPLEHFHLDCNGHLACENLELELIIPEPVNGCVGVAPITEWKGISCGTGGGCEGMKFTIVNNGCNVIILEELKCNPGRACYGAIFNFNAGNSIAGGVHIKNCVCGMSCRDATGIDQCFANLRTLECPDISSCASQKRTVINPSNDFLLLCSNTESCYNFDLSIIISGASQNLVRRFAGIDCAASMACKNAVVSIDNTQMTSAGENVMLYIADIICSQTESCDGTTFILSEHVHIQRVICTQDACNGCIIKQTPDDVGLPCDGSTTTTTIVPTVLHSITTLAQTGTTTSTTTTISPIISPSIHVTPVTPIRSTTISPRSLPFIPVPVITPPTTTLLYNQAIPQFIPAIPEKPIAPPISEVPPTV